MCDAAAGWPHLAYSGITSPASNPFATTSQNWSYRSFHEVSFLYGMYALKSSMSENEGYFLNMPSDNSAREHKMQAAGLFHPPQYLCYNQGHTLVSSLVPVFLLILPVSIM
jgi:hypothetical protein